MRLPGNVKAGVGLIVLGILGFSAVHQWTRTRIVYPVDMPVSLARGHIRTRPFRLNLRARYWISIDPGTWWLLQDRGCYPDAFRRLETGWILYRDGKVVDRQDKASPYFTGFDAGSGVYEMDLEVLNDAGCLDPGRPRLFISADTDWYDVTAFLLAGIASIGVFFGVVIAVFLPIVHAMGEAETKEIGIANSQTIGQNYQWARRLPLRRKISGLPSFGLVAAIFFSLVGLVVMFFTIPAIPKGVWVRVLQPGAAPPEPDRWSEPLIVRVRFVGYGVRGEVFVNAKKVEWDELEGTLKQELARRRDWVVYVGGDEDLSWQEVVNVIDAARQCQAKVVLTSDDSETR